VLLVADETRLKCMVATDGEYIYTDNMDDAVYKDEQHCISIYDMSGGEIGKVDTRLSQSALYVSDGRIYTLDEPIKYIDVDDVRNGDVDWKQ
jgi:translation initiation factor RLI1